MGKLLVGIFAVTLFTVLITSAYLLIRHYHRKWYWEDEEHKAELLRDAMREAGISYEVDSAGQVRPTGAPNPRTSGRAR